MYKKLSFALCFVLILLFVIAMIFIVMRPEVEKSKDPPSILIYLDEGQGGGRRTLIHVVRGEEFVIDRVKLGLLSSDEKLTASGKSLLFVCNATFPVQWKFGNYLENGSIDAQVLYRRQATDFYNARSYTFSTTLRLKNVSEDYAGYYDCIGFRNSDLSKRFYLFVPPVEGLRNGSNIFTIGNEVEIEVNENDPIVLPCPVSDPGATVTLKRMIQPHKSGVILGTVNTKLFDPKVGFSFRKSTDIDGNPPWGVYICQNENSGEWSALVKVFKPLEQTANYSVSETLTKRNRTAILVTCDYTDEVYFEFDNFENKRKFFTVNNETNRIRARIPLDYFRNGSTIRCATSTYGYRILYSWKFGKDGTPMKSSAEIMERADLSYNATTKTLSCCADSDRSPKLRVISCNTETECRFQINDKKKYYSFQKGMEVQHPMKGCSEISIKIPPSALQCSLDGNTKSKIFKTEFYFKQLTSLLRLTQTETLKYKSLKYQMRFDCEGPKFLFAHGFQWAWQRKSKDSGVQSMHQGNSTEHEGRDIHEWIRFELQAGGGEYEIFCFAPLLESPTQWINVSTTVTFDILVRE